ncbi:MAG: DUF255 domain-containing protein [Pseudomonadota bacterium]
MSLFLKDRIKDDLAWQGWTEEALQSDKLVVVFIGYHGCTYTAEVAATVFGNSVVQEMLIDKTTLVTIDAQVQPELDMWFQAAAQALGLAGGWPLTLLCTPQGAPIWAATVLSTKDQEGLPGFPSVLSHFIDLTKRDPEALQETGAQVIAHVAEALEEAEPGLPPPDAFTSLGPAFMARMDLEHGGITGTPKFPHTTYFEQLWRAYLRTGRADFAAAVQLTYTNMVRGGLNDHIHGGFFRYSRDGHWSTPDQEKTIYDNILILNSLLYVHGYLPQPHYAAAIGDTAGFIASSLALDNGLLSAGVPDTGDDAVYRWTSAEAKAALGRYFKDDEIAGFLSAFGLDQKPVPSLDVTAPLPDQTTQLQQAAMRVVLAEHRKTCLPKPNPLAVTSWTMLAVASLVRAGKVTQQSSLLARAVDIFTALVPNATAVMQLPHSKLGQEDGPPALLDDMAATGLAALTLACGTGETVYLRLAQSVADHLIDTFLDDSGVLRLSAHAPPGPPGRISAILDRPIPSATALAIRFLGQISDLTGAERYSDNAAQALNAVCGRLHTHFMAAASLLGAYEDMLHPVTVFWDQAAFDSETIAWALAPPGALIVPPGLCADGPEAVGGIVIDLGEERTPVLRSREAAIDALRNCRRVPNMEPGDGAFA